jgi:hypothetical protein
MSAGGFQSHRLTVDQADALLHARDAFGGFEDFDQSTPGDPGRRIAITPQILAREAALMAERERLAVTPAMEWRQKVQLNEDNLRTVPIRAARPGRVASTQRIALPQKRRVRHSGKFCESADCSRDLSYETLGNLCRTCRKLKTAAGRPTCGECGKELRGKRPVTVCRPCRRLISADAAAARILAADGVRPCSTGCGRELRIDNKGGLCWVCSPLARAAAEKAAGAHKLQRFACEKGCGRLRRGGRGPGLCVKCKAKSRKVKLTTEQRRKYQCTRNQRENRRCGDCGVLIKHTSVTGYCRAHAPARRSEMARA